MATPKEDTQIALIGYDVKAIKTDVKEIKETIKSEYVPLSRYVVVERIVFALVGLILVAVVGALLRGVIK